MKPFTNRTRRLLAAFLGAIVTAPLLSTSAPAAASDTVIDLADVSAEQFSETEAASFAYRRGNLGFPASVAYTNRILDDDPSVVEKFGLPLTAKEAAELDRRSRVFAVFEESLRDHVEAHPDYSGVYIDHSASGRVVVLTTGDEVAIYDELLAIEPRLNGELVVRKVQHTWRQVADAAETLFRNSDKYFDHIPVFTATVDERGNAVAIGVPRELLAEAQDLAREASLQLEGVSIYAEAGSPVVPTCSNRDNCHSPMRAGVRISGGWCGTGTMGFHVRTAGPRFLTAGHCTNNGTFYHQSIVLGPRQGNLYPHNEVDIQIIAMPSAQRSNQIYLTNTATIPVSNWQAPTNGMPIGVSLGQSNNWRTGQVTNRQMWYSMGSSQFKGARYDVNTVDGDSGSPVWHRAGSPVPAVGVHSGRLGSNDSVFARVSDAAAVWHFSVP